MTVARMKTELFLLRHGEPELRQALLGSTNSPLTEKGWQQLCESYETLTDIQQLISSPLSRCAEFADFKSNQAGVNLSIEPRWQECHFGDWDGLLIEFLHQKYPQQLAQFFDDPAHHMPPNSEGFTEFSERVEQLLLNVLDEFSGKRIAVITHAGVIRTLVAWCLQMDYIKGTHFRRFAIEYGSVTHISIYQDKNIYPQLVSLNSMPKTHNLHGDSNE